MKVRPVSAGLLYSIMCFAQIRSGQLLAATVTYLLCFLSFIFLLSTRRRLNKAAFACCCMWLGVTIYLLRPEYLADIETKIDVFWLVTGSVMLLSASMNAQAPTASCSILYEPAFLGASLLLVSMATRSTLWGLLNPPYAGTRLVGGFDGPNEMGAFYTLALTLMLGEHFFRRPVRGVWAKTTVFVIAVLSSWSRGAYVALGFMYALGFWSAYRRARGRRRKTVAVLFVFLTATIAYVFASVVLPEFRTVRPGAGDRVYLLQTTLRLVGESPLFGHGLGAYWFLSEGINATPHSEYLLFAVSGGVLGLLALIGFYAWWLLVALRKQLYPEVLALSIFYLLEAFFNNLVRGRVSFLFWGLVFLVLTRNSGKMSRTAPFLRNTLAEPGCVS